MLVMQAKVPVSVVHLAENSPGEPLTTINQLNALMKTLWTAGARFPPADLPA